MKICLLLHFYQPANQQDDILLRIVNECYLPVTRGLLQIDSCRVVINLNGALTQLLIDKGYSEVIDNIKKLVVQGKAELTGSAMYHSFLPLLPKDEIKRQITLNYEVNSAIFGDAYKPNGFFSPEMAVNRNVLDVASELGYKWIACPELSFYSESNANPTHMSYIDTQTDLKLLFRNKGVSSLILSAVSRDVENLLKETSDLATKDEYWFCVMDAETFGHHRIGHEKVLFDILKSDKLSKVFPEQLFENNQASQKFELRPSTWSNSEQDFWLNQENGTISEAKSFILWKDPSNPIHNLQWELTYLAVECVHSHSDKQSAAYTMARKMLDVALSSDQYWWASTKPWWSLEMIEQGAYGLKTVVSTLNSNSQSATKAEELYRNILDLAFDWQRSGYIRKRHTETSGTFMKPELKDRTTAEWFNQLVLEFEYEMNLAVEKQDFERAIKWRDAVIKISLGTDKYDILHVVDELWLGRNAKWATPQVKPFLEHDWSEFSDFAKKHFLNVTDEEQFKKWKQSKKSSTPE